MDEIDAAGHSSQEGPEPLIERPLDGHAPGPDESLTPGTRLGRYVVLEEIGSGGMGMVFSAYDPELNRKVALKLLRPRNRERKHRRQRLLKEAQSLAKLAHPNVVTVYDVGTYGERVFVAMELVEGTTLKGWLKVKPRKWNEVLKVFIPAGRGLAAAHAANLVHRDFKPDNVLIGHDDRVRVMDFGLARPMRDDLDSAASGSQDEADPPEAESPQQAADMVDPMLTQTGSVLGTPAYMAPEQHLGKATDARSDQFSFCTAMFQALYGRRPFTGNDAAELAIQKAKGQFDESSSASVPGWIRRHVFRGLSPNPEDRFPTMDALLDALADDPSIKRRKVAAGVATVAAMAGGIFAIQEIRSGPEVCFESADKLAAVWNDTRKAEVATGVLAASQMHVAWETAAQAVDDYGKAWVEMHTEACEATHLRGEQSPRLLELRNNCLEQRLDEVDAWAEFLIDPAQPSAARSAHAALQMSWLSTCADSEALASALNPPDGESAKRAVAAIRHDLARASVLARLARYDDALELAQASYKIAQTLDYQPVEAEARHRLGQVQAARGDYEAAKVNLEEAAWRSASVKHDSINAAANGDLVHLAGRLRGETEDGLSWARHADAANTRIRVTGYLLARLHHNLGIIYTATGELARAQTELDQALEVYATVSAAELAVLDVNRAMGDIRLREGKLDQAQAMFTGIRDTTSALLGATHPEVALAHAGLARVLDARGKHGEAVSVYRSALAMVETGYGEDDLAAVPLLEELAASFSARRDYDEAIVQKQRVFQLLQDRLGDHPKVAEALYAIGSTCEAAGDVKAAREHYERALALWESTRGKKHPDLAYALTSLGLLDVGSRDGERAVERLERALALRGGRGLDPRMLATTQFALARALDTAGSDHPRARELATKARDTFARGNKPNPTEAGRIDRWLTQQEPERAAGSRIPSSPQ